MNVVCHTQGFSGRGSELVTSSIVANSSFYPASSLMPRVLRLRFVFKESLSSTFYQGFQVGVEVGSLSDRCVLVFRSRSVPVAPPLGTGSGKSSYLHKRIYGLWVTVGSEAKELWTSFVINILSSPSVLKVRVYPYVLLGLSSRCPRFLCRNVPSCI